MFRFRFSQLLGPICLGLLAATPLSAIALEPEDATQSAAVPGTFNSLISDVKDHSQAMGQVTSVSQLSDVQPTDWAFQALQSLVERYGCIAGYPDGTFRGNRAATRYELAAALNACLDQISDRFATKEDLETVKALQEEFKAELATLKGRVDGLEARTATLEAQQFSTTTKLSGEAIFAAAYAVDEFDEDGTDRVFSGNRVRLTFDTSFTGTDRLRTRLEASNTAELNDATGTRMARLGFDGADGNVFALDELNYQFKPTKRLKVKIDANAGEFQDNVNTFNPYLESSGSGALSRFGRFNPIFRQGSGGAGVTLGFDVTDKVKVEVGYLGDQPENSIAPGGLINGSYAILAQVGFSPIDKTEIGLTYVRSFDESGNVNVTSSTASNLARRPFGNINTEQDHFGFQFTTQPASFINLSGWVGYTLARNQNFSTDSADLLNWAVSAQFPDLFRKGNVGYILGGQQPYIISANNGQPDESGDPNFHIEAGYKFKVNDFIAITPGVIVILNAENQNLAGVDDTVIVPVIRTTFKF